MGDAEQGKPEPTVQPAPAAGEEPPVQPAVPEGGTPPAEPATAPALGGPPEKVEAPEVMDAGKPETKAEEDVFLRFLERAEEEGLIKPAEGKKPPEPTDKPYRKTFVPDKDMGRVEERTNAAGQKEYRVAISWVEPDGSIAHKETEWMSGEEAIRYGAKKWNNAHLDLVRLKYDHEREPAPVRPEPKPTESFDFESLFGGDGATERPPMGRGGEALPGAGDYGLEREHDFAVSPPSAQQPTEMPSARQTASITDLLAMQAEQATRAEFEERMKTGAQRKVFNENRDPDSDPDNPRLGISMEEFEAKVEAEIEQQLGAHKRTRMWKNRMQTHFNEAFAAAQQTWDQAHAVAEDQLGTVGRRILAPARDFYERVLVRGLRPRTPEEVFLASNNNWTNTRLLHAMAMLGLRAMREYGGMIEKARREGREAQRREILEEYKKSRSTTGRPAIPAEQRASAPGLSASPQTPTGFATGRQGPQMPPEKNRREDDHWARFQAELYEEQGAQR